MPNQQENIGALNAERDRLKRYAERVAANIAALENKIASLSRDAVDGGHQADVEPADHKDRDPPVQQLVIGSEGDLDWLNFRVVRKLLDALPIQIFIKHAEPVPDKGRQYIYLNRAARQILNWAEEEVPQRFDGEAFPGGLLSNEWMEMDRIESRAIAKKAASEGELNWTPSSNSEDFRINKTWQVPIALGDDDGSLQPNIFGLCVAALDVKFQTETELRGLFVHTMMHEYGNLAQSIFFASKQTESLFRSILQTADKTLTMPVNFDRYLKEAEARAKRARGLAEAMLAAFNSDQSRIFNRKPNEWVTASDVCEKLKELTAELPIFLDIQVGDALENIRIKAPAAVLAVLLELIRNAEKYTMIKNEDISVIPVAVSESADRVTWRVSNRRQEKPGKHFSIAQRFGVKGANIVGRILERAFNPDDLEAMIDFPPGPDADNWMHVKLIIPRFIDAW